MTNSATVLHRLNLLLKAELNRRIFWEFCLEYDREFFEKRIFLKQIADGFQKIADGKIKKLSISMPPRAGKSYITSLFSAWMIGKFPNGSVMRNCCTATLYEKFSGDTRDIMRSEKFRDIFPSAEMAEDKQSLKGWSTTQAIQVSYFGAGVGGTIIGFGASLVAITDDLFKSFEDAMSEKVLEGTHSWYRGTHISRFEKECPAIDIGTRWSKKDIIGKNIEDSYYDEIITVSAMNENGESFCEEVKTTAEYQDIRQRTPKEIWMSEYMQSPIEASGTLFTKEDLKRFKMEELKLADKDEKGKDNQLYESVLGYIDVADEGTDKLCFITGHVFNKKVFVTDVLFTRDNVDITLPLCAGLIERWKHDYVQVEVNNQGSVFIKMLDKYIDSSKLVKLRHSTNKHSRILNMYGFIKEYFYFREDYEKGSEYDLFMQEIFEYVKAGTTKHDDAPDSVAGLAKFIYRYLPHLFDK